MKQHDAGAIAREILRKALKPGQSVMRGDTALRRLSDDARIGSIVDARRVMKALVDAGEISCDWVERHGPAGNIKLTLRAREASPEERAWRETLAFVLEKCDGQVRGGDAEALASLWPSLKDWPAGLAGELVGELYDLRRRLEGYGGACLRGFTAYRASASGRLASSKLLSLLPRAALRGFGMDPGMLPDMPPYVVVAGPAEPRAVILVENPEAFEAAVTATQDLPVAWISAYGFGISHVEGTGSRLASAIRGEVSPIPLLRSGRPPALRDLLEHERLLHWGDLDRAGLAIFNALLASRPQLRLSGLYGPMVDLLREGGGHPYQSVEKPEPR
jgi:hypothetical protein